VPQCHLSPTVLGCHKCLSCECEILTLLHYKKPSVPSHHNWHRSCGHIAAKNCITLPTFFEAASPGPPSSITVCCWVRLSLLLHLTLLRAVVGPLWIHESTGEYTPSESLVNPCKPLMLWIFQILLTLNGTWYRKKCDREKLRRHRGNAEVSSPWRQEGWRVSYNRIQNLPAKWTFRFRWCFWR
jgi:hypothetical protein